MATPLNVQNYPRPPIELIAEGLWRIGCGTSCQEDWDDLPEQQRTWWCGCASEFVKQWMNHAAGCLY